MTSTNPDAESARPEDQPPAPPTEPGAISGDSRGVSVAAWLVSVAARLVSVAFRIGVVVVLLLAGAGVLALLASGRVAPEAAAHEGEYPIVETVRLSRVPVTRVWTGYGTARAMNAVDISAEVSAVVADRPDRLEPGVDVGPNELLLQLDPADFEQRLAAAQERARSLGAQLDGLEAEAARLRDRVAFATEERDAAARDLERVREAEAAGASSPGEVDAARTAVQRAKGALAQVQQLLELIPSREASLRAQKLAADAEAALAARDSKRSRIVSPIAGRLQLLEPEEDELVAPGALVARVVDLRRIEVPVRLPVSAGLAVRPGDAVELSPDGPGGGGWSGTIARVSPEADASTRTLTVYVEVEQDPEASGSLLLPGRFVSARVESNQDGRALVAPRSAVLEGRVLVAEPAGGDTGGLQVWARSVRVLYHVRAAYPELDPVEREWAVLGPRSALDEGDLLIVSNLSQLREAMLVRSSPRVGGDGGAVAGEGSP